MNLAALPEIRESNFVSEHDSFQYRDDVPDLDYDRLLGPASEKISKNWSQDMRIENCSC